MKTEWLLSIILLLVGVMNFVNTQCEYTAL